MNRRDFMAMLAATSLPGCQNLDWTPAHNDVNAADATKTPSPLVSYVRTNWSRDPFSYGSIANFAKGSGDSDR